jgi:soluble lytic murein transglycosylase-like protein
MSRQRNRAALRWLLASSLALAAVLPARADVWGFIDAKGVARFAAEKVDERYQLFFRSGESFDTADGLATPRAVAVSTPAPRLLAFFDISPSFRQVRHHVKEAASVHGIDYELLQALIVTESGFDPQAVSPKGAIGLMQVMPATARRYGLSAERRSSVEAQLTDPRTNVRTGARYLSYLIKLFPGQLELALAAYNAGEGAVQRAGNRIPDYRETRNYVATVMQLYRVLKPPSVQAAAAGTPSRVRMELPAPPLGGAAGRGNLPTGLPLAAAQPAFGADPE